jgi:hypothetical protein
MMSDLDTCLDYDGNTIQVGDKVWYYEMIKCQGKASVGRVWAIGDMNEKQTNMPYLRDEKGRNIGAYSKCGIRKYDKTLAL